MPGAKYLERGVYMANQPTALVTGGSRGIGRATCVALAREGYTVVINYAGNLAAAEETLAEVEKAGGRGELCQADVGVREERALLLEFCMDTFGRLDVLVNNAAITSPERGDLLDVTEKAFDQVMKVNLKGPFFLSQAAAKLMIKLISDKTILGGTIINMSSISAYASSTNRGEYCISKAGLSMATMVFADRLADEGIRVYEIRPGVIETDMTGPVHDKYTKRIREGLSPIRRWGKPQDVGKAVAMLARGDLAFSTGEVINVDGGFHFRRL